MTIYSRNCYTYLIGWSKVNIWYYGRRTKLGCDPTDFWRTYFTSSIYVKIVREQQGDPDIIQIRKVFGENYKLCEKWETKVLKRLNAASRPDFLNKSNNSSDTTNKAPAFNSHQQFIGMIDSDHLGWGEDFFGINKFRDLTNFQKAVTEKQQVMAKMGIHSSQLKSRDGTHHFLSGHPSRSKVDQLHRDMVAQGTHHWVSDEHKVNTGKRMSKLIEEGKHPSFSVEVKCPRCDKTGQKALMYRWHFDKCKAMH